MVCLTPTLSYVISRTLQHELTYEMLAETRINYIAAYVQNVFDTHDCILLGQVCKKRYV